MQDFNMLRAVTEATVIAVSDRFGKILKSNVINRDILFTPDELAFRMRAEKDGRKVTVNADGQVEPTDKYTAEFINVWCTGVEFSWARQRTSAARTGIDTNTADVTPGGKEKVLTHKAVPVDMTFSVSLWTKYRENVEQFIQEFMFWQQDNPNIELFYDEDKKLEFDIKVGPHIEYDDQSIKRQFLEGKYWKYTINFVVEVWVIKGFAPRTALHIILDVYSVSTIPDPAVQVPEALTTHEHIDVETITVALMVTSLLALTADEIEAKEYLISRGHIVTMLDSITLPVADTYDVVVFGQGWAAVDISGIQATTAGVVLLCNNLTLGFGSTPISPTVDYIKIESNKHYITAGLGIANLEVSDATAPVINGFSVFTNQELQLAQYAIGVCEQGDMLGDGSTAAARRAIYGDYAFHYSNDDSRELFNRTVRWAGKIENTVDYGGEDD